MTHKIDKRTTVWTLVITSLALFMVSLDNLVVTTALPVIRHSLHASLSQLEWTVNAYTLTFAVLLLTGAALGDRFGRRRVFVSGLVLFTAASALAALATSAGMLDVARALQGVGGAVVMPLTLTILSAAVPAERRGVALGIWGGIGGLAVAFGPLVGGAVVSGISWNWIFWLNVPVGLVLAPLAWRRLDETTGADRGLDLPGLGLASAGLLGIVWGLVRGNGVGWTSPQIVTALAGGTLLVGAFVWWESRAASPMLPMQFFQTVQHMSPLQSGLRILPWTAMPMLIAPLAGAVSDRLGGERLMAAGLLLQASGLLWIAAVSSPTIAYTSLIGPFALSGIGMSLFFAPVANVILGAVRPEHEGKASGANNAIRELGGVFGVAVLAAVFAHVGGYQTAAAFTHGMTVAVTIGGVLVAVGAAAAGLANRRSRGEALEPALGGSIG